MIIYHFNEKPKRERYYFDEAYKQKQLKIINHNIIEKNNFVFPKDLLEKIKKNKDLLFFIKQNINIPESLWNTFLRGDLNNYEFYEKIKSIIKKYYLDIDFKKSVLFKSRIKKINNLLKKIYNKLYFKLKDKFFTKNPERTKIITLTIYKKKYKTYLYRIPVVKKNKIVIFDMKKQEEIFINSRCKKQSSTEVFVEDLKQKILKAYIKREIYELTTGRRCNRAIYS